MATREFAAHELTLTRHRKASSASGSSASITKSSAFSIIFWR